MVVFDWIVLLVFLGVGTVLLGTLAWFLFVVERAEPNAKSLKAKFTVAATKLKSWKGSLALEELLEWFLERWTVVERSWKEHPREYFAVAVICFAASVVMVYDLMLVRSSKPRFAVQVATTLLVPLWIYLGGRMAPWFGRVFQRGPTTSRFTHPLALCLLGMGAGFLVGIRVDFAHDFRSSAGERGFGGIGWWAAWMGLGAVLWIPLALVSRLSISRWFLFGCLLSIPCFKAFEWDGQAAVFWLVVIGFLLNSTPDRHVQSGLAAFLYLCSVTLNSACLWAGYKLAGGVDQFLWLYESNVVCDFATIAATHAVFSWLAKKPGLLRAIVAVTGDLAIAAGLAIFAFGTGYVAMKEPASTAWFSDSIRPLWDPSSEWFLLVHTTFLPSAALVCVVIALALTRSGALLVAKVLEIFGQSHVTKTGQATARALVAAMGMWFFLYFVVYGLLRVAIGDSDARLSPWGLLSTVGKHEVLRIAVPAVGGLAAGLLAWLFRRFK